MIETVFSIKQVNVDAALKQAEKKVQQTAKKIDKKLDGGGLDRFGDNADRAVRALDSVAGAAGAASTGVSGLAGDIVDLVKNPMSALIAALGVLVAVGVKVWDKLTLSAEQYSQKVTIAAERAKQEQDELNKAQAQDKGYLKRLQQLARAENLSNAQKIQAAKLIDVLSRRYGDLGVSIDMATGKIMGLDAAQTKMFNRMKEIALQRAKNVASSQENVASDAVKNAAGKGGLWSNFAPITFGDPSKSMSVSMAHRWNNMDLRNGEKGLNELKTSFLSSDEVKNLATQLQIARKKAADLKAEMAKNPSAVTDADKEKLQTLQDQAKHTETLLKLQQKLEVTQSMQRKAKTTQDIQNWRKAETEIKKYITTLKELKMQQDVIENTDAGKNAYETALKDRVNADAQVEKEKENQKMAGMSKKQKVKNYKQKAAEMEREIFDAESQLAIYEIDNSPKRQRKKELESKGKNITSKEKTQLLALEKELYNIDTQIEQKKKNIAQKQLERLQTLGKIAEYEREVKKYYADHKNNLNAEIKVQKLLNAGKNEAAERQKLINDLKKQGLTVDSKELDLIMKKRKQLAGLKMKDAFSSEAEKLLATVGKQVNGKQAEFQQRVADYEQKYGVKLSKSQKNAIKTLIDVESEIADMPKLSFKGMEIKTDELTARGGNAGGAVAPDKNAVNAQIRDYSRNQVKLLTDIKQTLKNAGII